MSNSDSQQGKKLCDDFSDRLGRDLSLLSKMVFCPCPEVDQLFLQILRAGEDRESELLELLSVLHDVHYNTVNETQIAIVEQLLSLIHSCDDEVIQQNAVNALRHFKELSPVPKLLTGILSDSTLDLDVRINALSIIRSNRDLELYRSIMEDIREAGLDRLQ